MESTGDLKRIQVKTSRSAKNGIYLVRIQKSMYVKADASSSFRYAHTKYVQGEIDYFFIICGNGEKYLIPHEVIGELATVSVTTKYAPYLVQ